MALDFAPDFAIVAPSKRRRGKRAYLTGQSAEHAVATEYDRMGVDLLANRWRGKAGEIDLIFLDSDTYVFCEVKAAPSHAMAMERLRPAQMQRICMAASEYLATTPRGQLSDVRFDLALVNAQGEVWVMENAFGHF